MDHAACHGTDLEVFFRDKAGPGTSREAKAICFRCPVLPECLEYALERPSTFGVWGATTHYERVRLRAEAGNEAVA
jgi:WhiB family transcriptional regulator, redox-sensing transcriptional regulator